MMSNHYHLVVTDVSGQLPRFVGWLNREMARYLQKHRKWRFEIWEPNQRYSAQELLTPEAVWQKILYCLTNPVKAGLVPKSSMYLRGMVRPGHNQIALISAPTKLLKNKKKATKETLTVSVPAMLDVTPSVYNKTIRKRLVTEEKAARRGHRRFVGWDRIVSTSTNTIPKTKAPKFKLNPCLAACNRKVLIAASVALRAFRDAYRTAYDAFAAGDTDVSFPDGTWWMVQHFDVSC